MSRVNAPGRLAIAMKIGLLAVTSSSAWMVQASTTPGASGQQRSVQAYTIGAGTLMDVLTRFASQAGVAISFDAAQLQGLQSPGLNGSFGVADGFARILGDSGLQAEPQASGTYRLRAAPSRGSTMELGTTTIDGQLLTATTEDSGSYTTGAVTIGKGEHTLRETPQSVTVITRKMLDDQNLNTIDQVMEKTPGITVYDSTMGGKYFYSRGFRMSANTSTTVFRWTWATAMSRPTASAVTWPITTGFRWYFRWRQFRSQARPGHAPD
jgi:outer membrane receptor for ferric coprogen and ferric-rhodotorulic acid